MLLGWWFVKVRVVTSENLALSAEAWREHGDKAFVRFLPECIQSLLLVGRVRFASKEAHASGNVEQAGLFVGQSQGVRHGDRGP